ncbi:MAG: hypothetical protein M1361_01400 [Patescibacteria group bacterium]|nr:hypothetical protein [Patescibacteria group bacterium]MCL5224255.1 hypothetical protein [Patescibacteria group bacterium]
MKTEDASKDMKKRILVYILIAVLIFVAVVAVKLGQEGNKYNPPVKKIPTNMSFTGNVSSSIAGASVNVEVLQSSGMLSVTGQKGNQSAIEVFGPAELRITYNISKSGCMISNGPEDPQFGSPTLGQSSNIVDLPANNGSETVYYSYVVACKNSNGGFTASSSPEVNVSVPNISQYIGTGTNK